MNATTGQIDFWKNSIHLGTVWQNIFIDGDISRPIYPALSFSVDCEEPTSFSLNVEGPFLSLPVGYLPVGQGKISFIRPDSLSFLSFFSDFFLLMKEKDNEFSFFSVCYSILLFHSLLASLHYLQFLLILRDSFLHSDHIIFYWTRSTKTKRDCHGDDI